MNEAKRSIILVEVISRLERMQYDLRQRADALYGIAYMHEGMTMQAISQLANGLTITCAEFDLIAGRLRSLAECDGTGDD